MEPVTCPVCEGKPVISCNVCCDNSVICPLCKADVISTPGTDNLMCETPGCGWVWPL